MSRFKSIYKVTGILIFAGVLLYIALYNYQKQLLFPTHVTKPVAEDWTPYGKNSVQALLNGNCGDLHVAVWRRPNPKGTVMLFHGNGESLASLNDDVNDFHQIGYNLMAWDYPGYGRSDDCWFNQEMLLDDANTAYQWLTKQENPKNIYLFGYSIGTGIALSVAAKHHQQNPVFLMSAYDAISSIAVERFSDMIPMTLLIRFPMQTQSWVDKIQQPIYLIHGMQDELISPTRARSLVEKAKGKIKVEWVENASHANRTLFEYRNRWLKRLLP
jgi:pimeloyl-ACP methyl ester carboxylesterase